MPENPPRVLRDIYEAYGVKNGHVTIEDINRWTEQLGVQGPLNPEDENVPPPAPTEPWRGRRLD